MKTRDDYQLESGGFLNAVNGNITEAVFEKASGDYADAVLAGGSKSEPGVMLRLTVVSPDLQKPASQSFSVGSSELWNIASDGKSIANVRNEDKHLFREGSRAGSLVEAMMTAVGEGDLAKGQDFFIKRNVYMTDTKFYENLNFYWEVQKLPKVGGGTTDCPLPARFLGEGKADATGAAPAAAPEDTIALDMLVVANATGKTSVDIKKWAIKEPQIKLNPIYMRSVVDESALKRLEGEGLLSKGPDGKYA